MTKTVEMGSLYLNNKPVPAGEVYDGERISFGDTVPGQGIPFVKLDDIYVANRCACIGVSWETLNKHGLIFGCPVKIDGKSYLCRSLKVGITEGAPNEWDDIVDATCEDDDFWHWKDRFFWGQETLSKPSFGGTYRMCRCGDSVHFWGILPTHYQTTEIGFRPVLEPLPTEVSVSESLIGHNLKIYGKNISLSGLLVGYNDYDLELRTKEPLSEIHSWLRQENGVAYIDREVITYLHRESES